MSPRALVPMSTCTHGAITASGQCRHAQRVQHAQRSVAYRTVPYKYARHSQDQVLHCATTSCLNLRTHVPAALQRPNNSSYNSLSQHGTVRVPRAASYQLSLSLAASS